MTALPPPAIVHSDDPLPRRLYLRTETVRDANGWTTRYMLEPVTCSVTPAATAVHEAEETV